MIGTPNRIEEVVARGVLEEVADPVVSAVAAVATAAAMACVWGPTSDRNSA
jgi:hypothetical protein